MCATLPRACGLSFALAETGAAAKIASTDPAIQSSFNRDTIPISFAKSRNERTRVHPAPSPLESPTEFERTAGYRQNPPHSGKLQGLGGRDQRDIHMRARAAARQRSARYAY